MTIASSASDADPAGPDGGRALDALIREDQLAGLRQSLAVTVPVNVLLSAATFAVAVHDGSITAGATWFAVSLAICFLRFLQLRDSSLASGRADVAGVGRQLNRATVLAGLSGLVWATTPLLATDWSSSAGVFHLLVGAGITAGSVALGAAYSRAAVVFITPILVANAGWLFLTGGFERSLLGCGILLYMAALLRSARQGERAFRETSRLKHAATSLARSLREARDRSVEVAAQMSHRALHDSLTGLLNRAGFLQELERRNAGPSPACCLMLVDLDGFKSINDAFGHEVGDRVLVEVGRRILAALPEGAIVARLGGDEFAVAYDRATLDRAAEPLARGLVQAIGAPFANFDAGRLGASIGIYEGPAAETANMLVYADEALYAAKSGGRTRCCFFDEVLRRKLERRRDSERDLLPALNAGALEVWYQPIFGEGGRRMTSLEALLRWNHPRHGWISPTEIVPAAAMAGQSERLLGFVLDEACAMARRLRALGRAELVVAVNVSPREMSQVAVDTVVATRLRAAGLPASALEIEITEETALDIRAVEGKLAELSGMGVRISVDDFGVGYSSLSILRQLRADRLKIDRSFVTNVSRSPDGRMLLQAMISLGRAMNLDVVAEGVETEDDLLTLRALGCQYLQGYLLGRPMTGEALIAILDAKGAPAASAA